MVSTYERRSLTAIDIDTGAPNVVWHYCGRLFTLVPWIDEGEDIFRWRTPLLCLSNRFPSPTTDRKSL